MEMKEREKLEGDRSNSSLSRLAIKEKRELRASERGNPKVLEIDNGKEGLMNTNRDPALP